MCKLVYVVLKGTYPLLFQWSIIQQLLNKIHMRKKHPSAAISFQAQGIEGITLSVLGLEKTEVSLPLVADDFPTCEAADWDNHGLGSIRPDVKILFHVCVYT